MNRALPWIVALACTGWAIAMTVQVRQLGPAGVPTAAARPAHGAASASLPIQTLAPTSGTPAHTFANEDETRAFTTLWRQRGAAASRMRVLQTYWDAEQDMLAHLNAQLHDDYNIDLAKRYHLDTDQRSLVELPPDQKEASTAETTGEAAPAPEPVVAHRFDSDEAMDQFTSSWQERLRSMNRLGTLQTYWNLEQETVQQISQQLADRFQIDPQKDYALSDDRRVLLEQPTPPAQPPAAASPQATTEPAS